jgi:arylsulfatase A-like enzyme
MRRSLLLLCLLAPLTACGKDEPKAPLHTILNLSALLDIAEIEREPGLVDVGTPEARAWLRKGWSWDETEGGRTFAWNDGPESEVDLLLTSPRDVPLTLRGRPYQFPGAPVQEVSLVLNGEEAGRMTLAPSGGESRVVLPERLLRPGTNRLVLRYAWTRSPRQETGADDPRHLAVAWDVLRFETGVDEQGRVRAAGDQLAIPFGWRVTTYLRPPAGAVLSWADLRSRDERPGELWVTVQTEESSEEEEAVRFDSNSGPAQVELEEGAGAGPVRISLAAAPGRPGGPAGGGLVLRQAALQAPRRAAPLPASAPAVSAQADRAALQAATGGRRPNVIIYLVDTLRADHLGCYGYGRPVSPRIDAFAREATLFRHTVAQSSWTRPSVATVLTGLLPRTHGVHRRKDALAPEALTLAEILQGQGYRTAGFATNANVAPSFGFRQGFEIYKMLGKRRNTAANIHALAVQWLETGWKGDAPFFLYLHTVEPHSPYNPPEPFRQRFAPQVRDEATTRTRLLNQLKSGQVSVNTKLLRDLLDLYDAEIATNDAAFGNLIDLLHQRGLWQNTVVVFVSDHGEEFFDHGGWEHGKTLHAEMLNVPLIVRIPGLGNGRPVDHQAQHADIVPTILDALGIPVPATVEGRSLVPWITGGAIPEDTEEEAAFSWLNQAGVKAASVTTPRWHLIERRSPASDRSLYDRRSDPKEQSDRAADRPVRSGYLAARIKAEELPRKGMLKAREGLIDPELREQLRALGYIH